MSITLNGSSQYVSTTGTTITAYPFSIVAWFNPTATGSAYMMVDISNNTSAVINCYRIRAAGDSSNTVRITAADGSSSSAVSTSTNFTASTWQRGYYIATSATARSVYLNNAGIGNDVTNLTATGISKTYIGVQNLNTVLSNFFSGSLAHVAIWNIALDSTMRSMLEAKIHPHFVARNNLVALLSFWDSGYGVTDMLGGAWTATGSPTYSADPGIRIPQYHL